MISHNSTYNTQLLTVEQIRNVDDTLTFKQCVQVMELVGSFLVLPDDEYILNSIAVIKKGR